MVLPWVTQGGPTPLGGLAECRAKGVCPRKEVPASLLHERGNHQVVDGKFCQGLCNPKRNFKYFSPASANVKLGPKGLTFWINRGKMNVAKRLLNHKGEGRGIWWFCFLHDIINSYLPSAGRRLMNCQSHVACCLCRMHRARKNWWRCAVLVCVHSPVPQTSPPPTSSIREGGGEFSLPFDVWSAPVLVTLSPWGNWGTRQLNAAKSLWWTQAAIDLSCKTVLPFLGCVASCSRSPAGLADRPAEGRALEGVVTWSTLCGQGNLQSVCTG